MQHEVKLLNSTPLWVVSDAIRTCWASQAKSDAILTWECTEDGCNFKTTDQAALNFNYCGGIVCPDCGSSDVIQFIATGEANRELIERVGNKNKHSSTLEHLVYNFYITGISRACLQELARHRIASLSVKSTRYTLKELKNEEPFLDYNQLPPLNGNSPTVFKFPINRVKQYLVLTGDEITDCQSVLALDNLRKNVKTGTSIDRVKYSLPESYKLDLAWTVNARSLQNFLGLRTSKAALWEIRELAHSIFNILPEDHQYLFQDNIQIIN